ncbi:type IV secretory system conjugative DNA transfer family protein [Weissella paramesenteroides]|uniref:type IV secretory system conjugative DNA transfer family protein n=1 Tax=Lactobacillaceae TaxID=33958 RepID=UPI003D35D8EE
MTDLIIFAVLIVWLIYLRVRNARQADNHKDAKGFSIRAIIFPIHYFIRSTIFTTFKSNGLATFFVFITGGFTFLLAMPLWYINQKASMIFLGYLAISWIACLFPQKTSLVSGDLGKAFFLDKNALKKGGLFSDNGVVFGKKGNQLVAKPASMEGNIAIFGGAGTGKTASNLIPTLLTYSGNAFVVDIKPELLAKTGHLHPNKKVLNFIEPQLAYDPLAVIESYTDVVDLAQTLIPISPDIKEPYFKESAQNILASACWEFKNEKSFSEIAEWLTANPADQIMQQLAASEKAETRILINAVAGIKTEQLASLMNELRNTLVVFATDPILRQLSGNGASIPPQDIEENWIYLVLPESQLQVYQRYLSLIVSQFTRYLTKRPEHATPNILMALDEFPRLGYMPAFTDAISTLRSRNVSVMILLQSLAQLDKNYQETGRKLIMDNMHYVVVHNALDNTSQKYFSDRAGSKTAVIKGRSYNGGGSTGTVDTLFGGHSTNYNQQSVPLIRPEEFATLQQPVLYAYKLGVAQVDKAFWFKDARMKALIEEQ